MSEAGGGLTLKKIRIRIGPNLDADWPCLVLSVESAVDCLATPCSRALLSAIATALKEKPIVDEGDPTPVPIVAGLAHFFYGLLSTLSPTQERSTARPLPSGFTLTVACADPTAGKAAAAVAVRWMDSFIRSGSGPGDAQTAAAFAELNAKLALGLENHMVVAEAMRRGIPWLRLHNNYVQLGQGHLQRRLHYRFSDRTSSIATELSTYKHASSAMMEAAGIPVARNGLARNIEKAVEIADGLGYPVVLKPATRDKGIGVQLNVASAAAVRRLYPVVREHGAVLVEKQEQGADHRLLVFDGKLAAAARRIPATIVGDGRQTIAALIAQMNADPRRGVGHSNILEKITIDDDVLRLLSQSGLSLTSVPAAGRPVALRLTANLSTGGTSEDVTGVIHPDNRKMAERAARIMNLDIAGIDFICRDISRSHLEVGGVVCEINVTPGFRPHLSAPGSPDVVERMVESLFPRPGEGRIPTALITGTDGKSATARMVAAILSDTGHVAGLATADGVSIAGDRIAEGDFSVPRGVQMLMRDPAVSAAVIETGRDGIAKLGLGIDRCSVGAVLNMGTNHLGADDTASLTEVSRAEGLVIKAAQDGAVLNADDPLCLPLRADFQGRQLILASLDETNPEIRRHLVGGGIVVVVQPGGNGPEIMLKRHAAPIFRMAVNDLPAALQEFNIQNAMFAIAIAASLGAQADNIRRALRGFRPDSAAR